MSSLMFASAEALGDMTVSFPNLFGGMEISYRRGFSIFGFNIYWYGVIIAVGVVLAYIYAMRRVTRDFGLVKNRVFDVVFVTIIGAFLCARIYYCVFINLNPNTPDTENYNVYANAGWRYRDLRWNNRRGADWFADVQASQG